MIQLHITWLRQNNFHLVSRAARRRSVRCGERCRKLDGRRGCRRGNPRIIIQYGKVRSPDLNKKSRIRWDCGI